MGVFFRGLPRKVGTVYRNGLYEIEVEPNGEITIMFGSEYPSNLAQMCGVVNYALRMGWVELGKAPDGKPLVLSILIP